MEVSLEKNSKKLILLLFFLTGVSLFQMYGQKKEILVQKRLTPEVRQDSLVGIKSASLETNSESPDTNFTYEKYSNFLLKISDTSKYLVLPINDFRKTINSKKIVVGLRHDVDLDLGKAVQFSEVEKALGFRSTYYVLHTADYYLANSNNKAIHNENIIPVLKSMQDKSGFEIGWHNDLVTLQIVYNIDPVTFLTQELKWLRDNGLKINGTASHGSNYCKVYLYVNFYFFKECENPPWGMGIYINNKTIPVGSKTVTIKKGNLSNFGLEYEAYFLNNNKYFSDASFIDGRRWDIGMLNLNTLTPGDRVIILLHPIHWHKASRLSEIHTFYIPGQMSSVVNPPDSTISVILPYGYSRNDLTPSFSLSLGAYVKCNGSLQTSGISHIDFSNPVIYRVFAENRNIVKNWTVKVQNAQNSACQFESFTIAGFTKKVSIDKNTQTVKVKVVSDADLTNMSVQFKLSDGASAWIGSNEQISNIGTVNFSSPVTYKIIAKDRVSTSLWTVIVEKPDTGTDFISFVVPGIIKSATIENVNRKIVAEVLSGQLLNSLPAYFQLSPNARAWVGPTEQISGLNLNNFSSPVVYKVIAEDSINIKEWTVTVSRQVVSVASETSGNPLLKVYPNPSTGRVVIHLENITSPESRIEIINSLGERIYSSTIREPGLINENVDLSKFPSGIYIVKCSSVRNPVIFVMEKN